MNTLWKPIETETRSNPVCEDAASFYLEGLRALPTLPSVLFRFLGLIADPDVTEQQLADFIWKDPALLSRAIPLLRASSGGRTLPASQLRQAIGRLGRERIRNLAFTTPLVRSLEPLRLGFNPDTFWERSLYCAHAAEALARRLEFPAPEQCYVAGLLHDIGYLLVLQKKPAGLRAVMACWGKQPGDLLQMESEVLGMDHCRLGREAARKLGLDPWLEAPISQHHFPTRDSDGVTRITCIAGAFSSYQGMDFFPVRMLARNSRAREMEEIIQGLLPEQNPGAILQTLEEAASPIRHWFTELLTDFALTGRKMAPSNASQEPARTLSVA